MTRRSVHCLALGIALSAGTAAIDNACAREVPAVIVQPSDQSRAALQQAVSRALKRESVILSSDALTQSSRLIVEPVRARDAQGQVIYDRQVRVLERFRLVKSWWRCILVQESTQDRYKLSHTKCEPTP